MAENVTLKRAVAKGDKIGLRDVAYDSRSYEFRLYEQAVQAADVRARGRVVPV